MNERLRELRKALDFNQDTFGEKLGVSNTAISKWEKGERSIPDSAIMLICSKFRVSEIWLRTGAGEMFRPVDREAELADLVKRRLLDCPDSFQAALVTVLLRFDPDGPEWEVVERIYRSVASEIEKDREP